MPPTPTPHPPTHTQTHKIKKKTSHQAFKIDGVSLIAVITNTPKVLIKLIGMNYSVHMLSRLMKWESVDPGPIVRSCILWDSLHEWNILLKVLAVNHHVNKGLTERSAIIAQSYPKLFRPLWDFVKWLNFKLHGSPVQGLCEWSHITVTNWLWIWELIPAKSTEFQPYETEGITAQ